MAWRRGGRLKRSIVVGCRASCGGGRNRYENGRVCYCERQELAAGVGKTNHVRDGIPGIMASASIGLLDDHLLVVAALHEQQQKGGRDKEDNVHDAEGEAGLEHGACLVHRERERVVAADSA